MCSCFAQPVNVSILTYVAKGLVDSGEIFSGQEGKLVVEVKEAELLLETFGISACFSGNAALPVC